MSLTRNRFYLFMSLACLVGYGWVVLVSQLKPEEVATTYDVCLIRHFAHIPCPSCGSTRSVIALIQGDLAGGLYWNPLGFVIFGILVVSPFWIVYDILLRKDTCYHFFLQSEKNLRRKIIAIPAIVLLLINWIWNIWKGV